MRNNESYLHTKISGWVTKLTFDIQALLFLVIAIYTHISVSGVVFWRINGWLDSSSSRAKSFTRSYSENMYKSISEIGFHIVLWSYDVQTFQKIIIAWDSDCLPWWLLEMSKYYGENSLVGCHFWGNWFIDPDMLISSCYTGAKSPMLVLRTIHSDHIYRYFS